MAPETNGANQNTSKDSSTVGPEVCLFPKPKDKILFKCADNEAWKEGEVLGRAGKATGKYKSWLNVKTDNGPTCIDLREAEWKIDNQTPSKSSEEVQSNEEVILAIVPQSHHHEGEVVAAKERIESLERIQPVYRGASC